MVGHAALRHLFLGLAVLVLGGASPAWGGRPFQEGMVSITLDDGWITQYTVARPMLNQRGIRSTYYITSGFVTGSSSFMLATHLQTLVEEGNEIACHTVSHSDLNTLPAAQMDAELYDSAAWLTSTYNVGPVLNFASPYGKYNETNLANMQRYYSSHRTVNYGLNYRDTNVLQLRAHDVNYKVPVTEVYKWIDNAIANKAWLILLFHEFVSTAPTKSTQIPVSNFQSILDYIQSTGIRTVTVAEGHAMMDGRLSNPSGYATIYDDTPGDGFADYSWATVRNIHDRTYAHSGQTSMSFKPDNWQAIYFRHVWGLDASRYSDIELWVHGGTTGGQLVRVEFHDAANTFQGNAQLDQVLGHPIQAGTWERVVIPLSSVGLSSGTISQVYIQAATKNAQDMVYIDDVRLIPRVLTPTPLYVDSLGLGLSNWSWANHNLEDPTFVHGGVSAISFEPDLGQGLQLHHAWGLEVSLYNTLELWIHGGTTGGQLVQLTLQDGQTVLGSVRLDDVLGHPIQAGTWERVVIPLSTLGVFSGNITDIRIEDDSGGDQGTLYLDDLQMLPN